MSDLVRRSLEVFFHPCAQMQDMHDLPPLEVVAAQGVWLELADGRRLIDGIASWWCKSLGHGHPRLLAALQQQAQDFEHVIAANTTHQGLVRLCERLLALANGQPPTAWAAAAPAGKLPGRLSRVFLADNGSTAVEIALKMAIQAQAQWGAPQRRAFACLAGGYHGESIATLSVGNCDLYSAPFRSLMFPALRLEGLPLRTGPDDPRWLDASSEWPALEAQLKPQADHLAALVYEPVLQGAGGMRLISPDLLPRLRSWADAHGVLLIADEIASGFGRCGPVLAGQLAPRPVLPDLLCCSKGLSGGVSPLSAVCLSEEIYQAFWDRYESGKSFLHSNTWTAHALGISVANAVLDVIAEPAFEEHCQGMAALLQAAWRDLCRSWPCLQGVRGVGMVAACDMCGLADGRRWGREVFRAGLAEGVFMRPLGNTLYVFPPLVINAEEIEQLMRAYGRALSRVIGPPPGR